MEGAHSNVGDRMVSDGALRTALESSLSARFDRPVRIEQFDRFPSEYSSSFAIEELNVVIQGHACKSGGPGPLRLIFKDISWRSLIDAARDVRPAFLYDPVREIAMYRDVLSSRELGTAAYYGSHTDEATGTYWLFLEHVAGAKLCHVGEFARWQYVARWLAGMHVRFRDVAPGALRLVHYDAAYYREWLERARQLGKIERAGANARQIATLMKNYESVVDRLNSSWQSMIHGEFYCGNILLQEREGGPRVCPIDWETAGFGPALMDLAALSSGNWDDAQRAALFASYREGLIEHGMKPPAPQEVAETVDCCRIHQALQWLGWSRDWNAPPDQSNDWLAELLHLSARLRV